MKYIDQPADRRQLLLSAVMLGVGLLWLYRPFLLTLVEAWGSNEDYSHGYLIPFIALYMVYIDRRKLAGLQVQPTNSGLLVIVAGLSVLVLGKIASEFFLQRFSLLVVLSGMILFLLGRTFFLKMAIPVCYLLFMIPLPAILWNRIAFPMQLFSSMLTERVVSLLGIPIFREGNLLHLSETTLEVIAACSGLRSLVTMFALAGVAAYISPKLSTTRKWIVFFAAAPIAILANTVRLTGTTVLASLYGEKTAQGFLHDFSGIVVFMVGLLLLGALYRFMQTTH